MKLLIIITILVISLFLQGCVASQLDRIPPGEFAEFQYDRAGNMSSVHITAVGAKKTNEGVTIDLVNIAVDYGPFVNFKVYIKGYKRPLGEGSKELGIEP